jgi:Tol biopolymer transport system component
MADDLPAASGQNPVPQSRLMVQKRETVAYATVDGESGSMIINGTVKATHSSVGSPILFPNSNSLAWIAFDEGKGWRLFVDGVEKFSFGEFEGYPAVSPDGKHIAIVTIGENGRSIMIDGQMGEIYDLIVAHESQRARFDDSGNCYYLAVRNDELFLVETKLAR